MILVVDSGSFKSDWMLRPESEGEPLMFRAKGINPFFTPEKEIIKIVQHFQEIKPYIKQVDEIYFFGSGCTSPDRREIVSNALSHVFTEAFISVDTDVIGSAYATCGNQPGFVATLGTGSNISFFDAEVVEPSKQGVGYILGDIGSGAWFGKKLITAYLYESMPKDLRIAFSSTYRVDKEIVIKNIYQRSLPNAYLASFAPFLSKHQQHPYISTLLRTGFECFVKTNICSYQDYQNHICHFVGSVAYHFRGELQSVCRKHKIQVGKIIQQPIQDLYHFVLEREELENNVNN